VIGRSDRADGVCHGSETRARQVKGRDPGERWKNEGKDKSAVGNRRRDPIERERGRAGAESETQKGQQVSEGKTTQIEANPDDHRGRAWSGMKSQQIGGPSGILLRQKVQERKGRGCHQAATSATINLSNRGKSKQENLKTKKKSSRGTRFDLCRDCTISMKQVAWEGAELGQKEKDKQRMRGEKERYIAIGLTAESGS